MHPPTNPPAESEGVNLRSEGCDGDLLRWAEPTFDSGALPPDPRTEASALCLSPWGEADSPPGLAGEGPAVLEFVSALSELPSP